MSKQSKIVPLRTTESIRQEAADWLVKLDNRLDNGGLSKRDWHSLKAWLAEDPRHYQTLKRQAEIWSDIDIFSEAVQVEPKGGLLTALFSIPSVKYAATAACVLLVSFMMVLFYPAGTAYPNGQLYETQVGHQLVERFPDGSEVHLNTDSLIRVEYSGSERKVVLLRGEAVFDVAHDPERPFSVYAEDQVVTAIGTKFVVRLTSEKIKVAVAEGKVQLTQKPALKSQPKPAKTSTARGARPAKVEPVQEVVVLAQGEEVEVSAQGEAAPPIPSKMEQADIERKFSWQNGSLIFDNESLSTIIEEVNRYTSIDVVIVDPELSDIRLSGRFKVGDTEALLEAIEISHSQVSVNRAQKSGTVFITADGSN